jgi:hypothetical protein
MARLLQSRLIGAFALLAAAAAQVQDVTVYDDALQNGFQDWSYGGGTSFTSTGAVHTGSDSISFDQSSYSSAISFAHPGGSYTVAQYPTLHFWVHGGATGNQKLQVVLQLGGAIQASAALDTYITGGAIAAGAWREVTVGFALAPLSYSGSFDRIDLEGNVTSPQPILYVDDVSLVPPAAGPANAIQIEHDVTVASMVSDRFTWSDGSNQPRVAVLAHNDGQVGPGSVRGGALREFRYQLPDGSTRIANVTTYGNGGYGGFGYVVSHASNYAGCVGDDSPLGDFFPGQFQRIFEGRHHVVFRFTQNYVRNCATTLPVVQRTVPVTIDWVFSTGRDNPIWAITWDVDLAVPAAPVNTFWDDSRGPYGELNIDGDGWTDIDGVAWGDRYKFTSTSAPVTLASQWSYDVMNTVPYVKLWLAAPMVMPGHTKDATMGLVQTQTMTQQDAAGARIPGYHDITECWGQTSANCSWAGNPNVMPWQDDWAYQANADSIGGGANNNARLTWRTQYGFLGQVTYEVHDGVVADPPGLPGYPKKSYSTYVVLGTHSSLPVEAQVTQVETVQSLTLSATIGSVVTSGPAGVARLDNVTYAPAGYNHVYGALAFAASGNSLDANIAVGTGTLKKPLLILGSYTGAYPTIKLGSVTLLSDVDYFPSLRAGASELWITLNRDLLGATNHLEVLPSCSPVPTPTIQASGLTTFCSGGSVTLTSSAGSSYFWSTGATTSSISVTTSGSYWVRVTNANGCQSAQSDSVVVTVNPIPSAPTASNSGPYCAGGAISLAVSTVAGATYSWTGPSGYASTVQNPTISNATTAMAGTYSVTATVNGCTLAAATTSVTVSAIPATPIITAPAGTVAGTTGLTASGVPQAGSSWFWTVQNGTITAGQGTSQITFTAGMAGTPLTLSVTETNASGCVSAPGNATVTVAPTGSGALFYTLPPCRVLDTRNSTGPLGAPPLQPGATRTFDVTASPCGIPAGAVAISANLTVTNMGAQGELVVFKSDISRPNTSSMSFRAGRTRANNAIVSLSASSTTFSVFNNSAATVDFILDVNGFFR